MHCRSRAVAYDIMVVMSMTRYCGVNDTGNVMQSGKPQNYYSNIRSDIVNLLKSGSNYSILELGCGEGATGRAILEAGKASHYTGIELDETSASIARPFLSEVIVGDVSNADLSAHIDRHDVLIMSEVIEHLQEPWTNVAKIPAGASSRNSSSRITTPWKRRAATMRG